MPKVFKKSSAALLLCLMCAAAVCLSMPVAAEDNALTNADNAFKASDYATAKSLYQQVYREQGAINDSPQQEATNAHVVLQLGHCCRLRGELFDAGKWFAKIAATYPTDRASCAQALFWIGSTRSLSWEYRAAVASLQQLLRDYPSESKEYPGARLTLARALHNDVKTDEAIAVLNQILQSSDYDHEEKGRALLTIAECQAGAGRYAEAEATCQSVSRDYADSDWLPSYAKWVTVGCMCENGSDPDATLSLIAELRTDPARDGASSRQQLTLWESMVYWAKGNGGKSEELLTGLITNPCGDWSLLAAAYYHRACIHTVNGEFDKAKADIEQIGKPCVYLKRLAMGDWYYYQDKYAEAAQEYEAAIVRLPRTRIPNSEPLKAFKRLAISYSRLGQKDQETATRQKLAEFEAAHR